jgi:brefeldin A-resistance guanine nucleotide exchange factor 1
VSENLKNMLLVLSNGGYLSPPDEKPEQEQIWNETWKRINRFQPNLLAEVFPDEAAKPKAPRDDKASVGAASGEEAEAEAEGIEAELVVGEGKKEKVDAKEG